MQRSELKQLFGVDGNVILPVIHVLDEEQAVINVDVALDNGAHGVFLINHDFGVQPFLPIIRHVRHQFPDLWLGLNFLAVTGKDAFPILAELESDGYRIDAYWADDARIDESKDVDHQDEAKTILQTKEQCGWKGMYFGGTAFKKQRYVDPADYHTSAKLACQFMDVVTTSGIATGHEADLDKTAVFRDAIGQSALALASGITPDNAHLYRHQVDAFLVATGINHDSDFYNINAEKLKQLVDVTQSAI